MRKFVFLTLCILMTGLTACSGRTVSTAPDTADQAKHYIDNKGSDTIVNLALAWAEMYQDLHSDVRISVTGGGSGTGITSLINKTVDIANASRKIKTEEIAEAAKNGVEPVEFVIARDAIAVIVNPENSVDRLTLEQISAIYTGKINNWSELGGEDRPIVRLSRETNSGTHVYFLEAVIRLGDSKNKQIFSADTLLLPSSEGIIAEVAGNPNAIGYDGLGYVTPDVKMLAVAGKGSLDYEIPSVETVVSGAYPISRDLYMYTNGQPSGALKDYLDWIFTSDAQKVVRDLGFIPTSTEAAN